MNEIDEPTDSFTVSPCGRGEAVELAIRTAVVSHLIICVLTLFALAMLGGPTGIWIGLGFAAALAVAIPFVILPIAAAIGFIIHLTLHRTQLSIPTLVRVVVILFEASMLGWVILIAMMMQ